MTDDLREAYRALQGPGSAQCPADEELAALVLGELPAERRDAAADHVVSCRRCTESAGVLFETHREASGARAASPSSRRRWVSLAAAAAAIAAIVLLVRPPERAPSAERGRGDRAAGFVPADGAQLAEAPPRFAWPPLERAETYRLKLYRDSGDPAWESAAVAAPSVELPPEARGRLGTGGAYYWVVEVEGPSGASRLGPVSFRIAPGR